MIGQLRARPRRGRQFGRDDVVTPAASFAMERVIRACGGPPRVTLPPDLGVYRRDPAYRDAAHDDWLLAHRRSPQHKDDQ